MPSTTSSCRPRHPVSLSPCLIPTLFVWFPLLVNHLVCLLSSELCTASRSWSTPICDFCFAQPRDLFTKRGRESAEGLSLDGLHFLLSCVPFLKVSLVMQSEQKSEVPRPEPVQPEPEPEPKPRPVVESQTVDAAALSLPLTDSAHNQRRAQLVREKNEDYNAFLEQVHQASSTLLLGSCDVNSFTTSPQHDFELGSKRRKHAIHEIRKKPSTSLVDWTHITVGPLLAPSEFSVAATVEGFSAGRGAGPAAGGGRRYHLHGSRCEGRTRGATA